jgi:integrase/recombinase XerD
VFSRVHLETHWGALTMNLSEAIEYFKICRLADGYANSTLEIYTWALYRLENFYPEISEISEISLDDLRKFMIYMQADYEPTRPSGNTDPLSGSSLENIWKALRSFFGWAEEELNIERPDLRLAKPPNPPPEISPFSYEEIQALLTACEYTAPSQGKRQAFTMHRPTAKRDRAIILTLLDTGIRVGECARLKIENAQLSAGKIYIEPWGSGRKTKSRHVYIGRSAVRALFRYLTERGEPAPIEHLFTTQNERAMNRNTIRHMVSALGRRADVAKANPHRFRHTFAIQYLRNGGDVFTLQRLLGHSSLEMVRRYLRLAEGDAAEAHRLASPVDRWKL